MNNKRYKIILCEGETDQILLGCYLGQIGDWEFFKGNNMPFSENPVNWFRNPENSILGIWQVGGNDFSDAVTKVLRMAYLEPSIEKLAIITDHDDVEAETLRAWTLQSIIEKELKAGAMHDLQWVDHWISLSFEDSFANNSTIELCYILVPLHEQGALETFMLSALSETAPEKEEIISQVKNFISNIKSGVYLKQRREKIKAQLGVSLSIFSPDRIFTTMNELLKSVNWADFETAHTQFKTLDRL